MRSGDVEKFKKFEEIVWKEMKKGIYDVIFVFLEFGQREGINCFFRIVEGNVCEKVFEEVNSGKYFFVVMGVYGKSGKMRIGFFFEDVVGVIKFFVMIVR